MEQDNLKVLADGLRQFGIEPDATMLDAISKHLAMVAEWNERVNLTAITQEREMVVKHAVDSVSLLAVAQVEPGIRLLDIGTGAGFPGIVLKCIRPEIRLVLLESLAKRCKFLEAVGNGVIAPAYGAGGYDVVWGRAEDFGVKPEFREGFDVVTARAVADMRVLCEYCLPFVKVGGVFVAMKGPGASQEVEGAAQAISTLGGDVAEVREIVLPESAGSRTLIRVKKVRPTPKGYPRKAGTPAKNPL
jgi:16S rRNA (guanine527-N7)-methyltransferase